MKQGLLTLVCLLSAVCCEGQGLISQPPPQSAYIFNGSGWVASTAASAYTPLISQPPPISLYCYNGTAWVPCAFPGGTLTNVSITVPAPLTATGCIITTAGTCAITWTPGQAANLFLATPNGSTGPVGLRAIVPADIAGLYNPISNPITTATGGSGTGTVTCLTAACTNLRGTYSVAGGTFTTGTLLTLVWPTTTTAYVCTATQNGGATIFGLGNAVATATGVSITSAVSVAAATVTINYSCQP